MSMIPNTIRLPRLISDGMVLQRNTQVKIWGWAPADQVISIRFLDQNCSTAVNEDGEWQVTLGTGDAGGPYDMVIETIDGTAQIKITNILLGDVWLCSGQSNMEMRMVSLKDIYPDEIKHSRNDCIRQFQVPMTYDFIQPKADIESGFWESADQQSVLNFTAAGYFCAVKLFEQYRVPIGLISASLGGAPAEAFMSEDALSLFPEYMTKLQKMKDRAYLEALIKEDQDSLEAWRNKLNQDDEAISDDGQTLNETDSDVSFWPHIKVPSYWEEEGVGSFNGAVWFRKEVEVPSSLTGGPTKLILGHIVDEDTVYINGTMIGTVPNQYVPRNYVIPEGLLNIGKNTILVRVVNYSGKGGFYKGKPYHLEIGDQLIDLSGDWQYWVGAKCDPLPAPNFVQWGPAGLYNGMIAPVVRYAIKGVLWYQGESNVRQPDEYEDLLKTLISDWRGKWGSEGFPFLYVQLPNFQEASDRPAESSWAELRDAQRRTLAVPGTGMAVAIDIGEWNDIHPVNKRDVGYRLALAARKVAYGDDSVVGSGPVYQSAKQEGNRIVLSFSDTGSGLIVKDGGMLRHFAIAGADRAFVWANARIENNGVAVWHEQISNPVYVRYAWADNPEGANLYNSEGLPASPFTTEKLSPN
ncbi:sialate O-acetylesterase [Paenibacillus sp. NEAU-GSW1]|uniref:sialate O-acetylesterase n=1 Tax=Paenibacillus sp. NEAU-GSW1 TaxID=2682486 RepID=UPI0012E258E6|nr:sialate O-acetylesterase [Paenibacillus sp. NEAU-GSW1]MUT68252.1 sialate O-acetylesterase [Paenibacillus sp. NEAU-GSW1]